MSHVKAKQLSCQTGLLSLPAKTTFQVHVADDTDKMTFYHKNFADMDSKGDQNGHLILECPDLDGFLPITTNQVGPPQMTDVIALLLATTMLKRSFPLYKCL